jgi:transcription elongation factor GreA
VTAVLANNFEDLVVTAEGYAELRAELEALRTDGRRELRERLEEARADGNLEDNPALYDVLEEQAQLERRIAALESRVAAARVVEPAADGTAGIGSYVRVRDAETGETEEYELVGPPQADLANGRLSTSAPAGRALCGRQRGETVEFETPRGRRRLEVLDVRAARSERRAA